MAKKDTDDTTTRGNTGTESEIDSLLSSLSSSSPPSPSQSLSSTLPPWFQRESASSLSQTKLFIIVLVLSVAVNCYVRWNQLNKAEETKTTELNEAAVANNKELEILRETLKKKENLLNLIKKDQIQMEKMFSISKLLAEARQPTVEPKIWFASNDTVAEEIGTIAKSLIDHIEVYSCTEINVPPPDSTYDVYKNCFRDIAIELHNRLELRFEESHFFVSAGRMYYSFLITTMHSKRTEYHLSVGDILFQVLEYRGQLISDLEPRMTEKEKKDVEEEEETISNGDNDNDNQDKEDSLDHDHHDHSTSSSSSSSTKSMPKIELPDTVREQLNQHQQKQQQNSQQQ